MQILLALDKFKGTLSSLQAARLIESGLRVRYPDARFETVVMADGGEGSGELLADADSRSVAVDTFDALMRPLRSHYLIDRSGAAVVVLADTVGMAAVAGCEVNPLHTSTYGFGVVVGAAVEAGCRSVVAALGGSATNDCGAGMLAALGCLFYDGNGRLIAHPVGADLERIFAVDTAALQQLSAGCRFTAACDVTAPLLGRRGAAHLFAPQKGADAEAVERLERGAAHFSEVAMENTWRNCRNRAGAGAAGGTGFGMFTFLDADYLGGAELVARRQGLHEAVLRADVVVTGEGRIDSQTFDGKVAGYVCQVAREQHKRVIMVCGEDLLGLPDTYPMLSVASREDSVSNPVEVLRRLSTTIEL